MSTHPAVEAAFEFPEPEVEQRLNREVGARIRSRRREQGLTLKQLALRTRLSISLISQVELGKSAASIFTLYKLAGALSLPMAWLFHESNEPGEAAGVALDRGRSQSAPVG